MKIHHIRVSFSAENTLFLILCRILCSCHIFDLILRVICSLIFHSWSFVGTAGNSILEQSFRIKKQWRELSSKRINYDAKCNQMKIEIETKRNVTKMTEASMNHFIIATETTQNVSLHDSERTKTNWANERWAREETYRNNFIYWKDEADELQSSSTLSTGSSLSKLLCRVAWMRPVIWSTRKKEFELSAKKQASEQFNVRAIIGKRRQQKMTEEEIKTGEIRVKTSERNENEMKWTRIKTSIDWIRAIRGLSLRWWTIHNDVTCAPDEFVAAVVVIYCKSKCREIK